MSNITILRGDQIEGIESSQNFIKNLGERNTAGWVRYNDGGSNPSRPIDGTGGTPTSGLDVTLSATNPLAGDKSFIFSKPASNCQGQGFSYDFAIDRASRAKVLKIEFDYLVDSGTFNAGSNTADSDLIVYLYDVDASQLIEPSTFKLYSNASNIADKFSGYFQTSASSTNYRLIFHVATTNASAWSLKVDNVVVTPSKYVYGTPITDWTDYPPQLTGSITNPTLGPDGYVTGRWRRIGDSIEIHVDAVRGTSGGSAGSGDYFLSLPSNIVADLNKISNKNNVGTSFVFDGGTAAYTGTAAVHSDGTKISAMLAPAGVVVTSNHPNTNWWTSAGLNYFTVKATLPIQGWSSSVRMSDGYEGREIAFRARKASQSGLTLATWTTVTFSSSDVTFDDVSGWNGTDTYTVRVSGKYRISGFAVNPSTGSGQYIGVSYRINGGSDIDIGSGVNGPAAHGRANFIDIVNLKAGDTVQFRVISENTTTVQFPTFIIERISSPQTIAMGEVVAGYAKNASGQVIPNGTVTTLTGWTTVTDTHAILNPSTGVLTVNRSGFIDLSAIVSFSPNSTGERAILFLLNNTTEIGVVDIRATSGGITTGVSTSISCYPVKSGDTFIVRAYQSSGGNLSIFNDRTLLSWRIY
jgi:hypothetical protein